MRIYVSGTMYILGWQSISAAFVSFHNGCSGLSLAQKVHFGALEKFQRRFLVQTFTDLLQRSSDAVSILDTVAV